MHWPLWGKIYYRPWLEQKHKTDYSFQSQVRKSGVTRVRKSGVRKSRVTKWRHSVYDTRRIVAELSHDCPQLPVIEEDFVYLVPYNDKLAL